MACGLTVIQRWPYRGNEEEYSNQYWFTGSTPADSTAWRAIFDALATIVKPILDPTCDIVGAYGYDSTADDATAVYSLDLTIAPEVVIPGTLGTARVILPGDSAVWVRWKTSRLNTKGKPVYLRKYFHPACVSTTAATPDTVLPSQVTALNALGAKLMDGTFIDGRKLTARGETDTIVSSSSSPYVTTRTLKRRGRRPGA